MPMHKMKWRTSRRRQQVRVKVFALLNQMMTGVKTAHGSQSEPAKRKAAQNSPRKINNSCSPLASVIKTQQAEIGIQ